MTMQAKTLKDLMRRWLCECYRCGHKWISKGTKKPLRCSCCKAFNWWRLPKGRLRWKTPCAICRTKSENFGRFKRLCLSRSMADGYALRVVAHRGRAV
jgi:hypothetical protein